MVWGCGEGVVARSATAASALAEGAIDCASVPALALDTTDCATAPVPASVAALRNPRRSSAARSSLVRFTRRDIKTPCVDAHCGAVGCSPLKLDATFVRLGVATRQT